MNAPAITKDSIKACSDTEWLAVLEAVYANMHSDNIADEIDAVRADVERAYHVPEHKPAHMSPYRRMEYEARREASEGGVS